MPFHLRPYSAPADQAAMLHLARLCQAGTLHVIDLPYRLSSWAMDEPRNIGLCVGADGQLAAWAVLQSPFWTVDLVCRPDLEQELLPEMLAWVDRRASESLDTPYGHPTWYVNAFSDQIERMRLLEQVGFACQSGGGEDAWSKVWMRWTPSLPVPEYPLPKGFTLRPLAGEPEVEAYVNLHQAVFESKNMTVEWRQRTLRQPDYAPDLDIVVAAPDGRLAAFCIGWLAQDAQGVRQGQVEPLGCHAEFRSYALGRLALCETLRRLHAHGAGHIFVETDAYRNTAFRLYESLGFNVVQNVLVYRKDYNDP